MEYADPMEAEDGIFLEKSGTIRKKRKKVPYMQEDTVKLLRECNSGCKMAINSMNQVKEYIQEEKLLKTIDEYDEKHRKLEDKISILLEKSANEEKEPKKMAEVYSWVSTEMKLMFRDDSHEIAKIMMNGCNMGIQSLSRYINEYGNASAESMSVAKDLVKTEEAFMKALTQFL